MGLICILEISLLHSRSCKVKRSALQAASGVVRHSATVAPARLMDTFTQA